MICPGLFGFFLNLEMIFDIIKWKIMRIEERMIMKRIIMMIFAVMILFSLKSASSFAEEIAASDYQEIFGSYPDGTTGFIYNDDMLLGDSSYMSGDLCKVAASLSAADPCLLGNCRSTVKRLPINTLAIVRKLCYT